MLYLKELRTRFSEAQILKRLARPADVGRMPGGGSVFDRAVIVILQSVFYHTAIFKSRNFCKLSGMRRLGAKKIRWAAGAQSRYPVSVYTNQFMSFPVGQKRKSLPKSFIRQNLVVRGLSSQVLKYTIFPTT